MPSHPAMTHTVENVISGVVNKYAAVTAISGATVTVGNASPPFQWGDRVVIIQMMGATIDESDSTSFGSVTDVKGAGSYEWATVEAVNGATITLAEAIKGSYDVEKGKVQLVRASSHYGDVGVVSKVEATSWDGATGGVIAIEAGGTINLGADLDASGKGFLGGNVSEHNDAAGQTAYTYHAASGLGGLKGGGIAAIDEARAAGRGPLANGGGGGNGTNAGGGGGGNGGAGGQGGKEFGYVAATAGLGGNALSYPDRVFMGGGGGGGQQNNKAGTAGANGGGIILLRARSVTGSAPSFVRANGGSVTQIAGIDGAGGGGAGGTILLEVQEITGSFGLEANGGNGGVCAAAHGPGGGGGGGVIRSTIPLPSSISTSVTGGKKGQEANNCADGGAGRVEQTAPKPEQKGIPGIIDVTTVVSTALEHLNRSSILHLLNQMMAEIDEHCRTVDGKISEAISQLRNELSARIESLSTRVDLSNTQITQIQNDLTQLRNQLDQHIASYKSEVTSIVDNRITANITEIVKQVKIAIGPYITQEIENWFKSGNFTSIQELEQTINNLQTTITTIQEAADLLNKGELEQVKTKFIELLQTMDLSSVLQNLIINVRGQSFKLVQLLNALAYRPQVKYVELHYGASVDDAITRVDFLLTDGTKATFTSKRIQQTGGGSYVDFLFTTFDLKGLPAEFSMRFMAVPEQHKMCNKPVTFTQYKLISQSNVVYTITMSPPSS